MRCVTPVARAAALLSLLLTVAALPAQAQVPKVTAGEVVDRETLKGFVTWATSEFANVTSTAEGSKLLAGFRVEGSDWNVGNMYLIRLVGFERANEWKAVLREDGGHFRSGPIYLFFFTADGYVIFHGANPWREGRSAEDIVDINGVPFFELLIAAAKAGGGFVEYFWDDPTVEGDEDTGSPKVNYALSFTNNDLDVYQGQEFILGAGFYRNFSTAEAEMAAEDWLHRFGRSVASQAMEMIGNRVSHADRGEDHVTVGGRAVDAGFLGGLASSPFLSRGALLGGSSFQVSPGASDGGGGYSVWGGGEVMRFTSGDGEGFGNGEVTTGALGADYCGFQIIPITDSDSFRSLIPTDFDH